MPGCGSVASPDACNQFRTARAITISARSQLCTALGSSLCINSACTSVQNLSFPPFSLSLSLSLFLEGFSRDDPRNFTSTTPVYAVLYATNMAPVSLEVAANDYGPVDLSLVEIAVILAARSFELPVIYRTARNTGCCDNVSWILQGTSCCS